MLPVPWSEIPGNEVDAGVKKRTVNDQVLCVCKIRSLLGRRVEPYHANRNYFLSKKTVLARSRNIYFW